MSAEQKKKLQWNFHQAHWRSTCNRYAIHSNPDGTFECLRDGKGFLAPKMKMLEEATSYCENSERRTQEESPPANPHEAEDQKAFLAFSQQENQRLRDANEKLRNENKRLQRDVEKAEGNSDKLSSELRRLKHRTGGDDTSLVAVIDHVLRERDYARLKWGRAIDEQPELCTRRLPDYLTLIQYQVNSAVAEYAESPADPKSRMAAIAQLAIACLLDNGLPALDRPSSVRNVRNGRTYQMPNPLEEELPEIPY